MSRIDLLNQTIYLVGKAWCFAYDEEDQEVKNILATAEDALSKIRLELINNSEV